MNHKATWLKHLRQLVVNPEREVLVLADRWAHDVRCVRSGTAHRRVGAAPMHAHEEWLEAGVTVQPGTRGV